MLKEETKVVILKLSGVKLTELLTAKYKTGQITLEVFKECIDYWYSNKGRPYQQPTLLEKNVRELFDCEN